LITDLPVAVESDTPAVIALPVVAVDTAVVPVKAAVVLMNLPDV